MKINNETIISLRDKEIAQLKKKIERLEEINLYEKEYNGQLHTMLTKCRKDNLQLRRFHRERNELKRKLKECLKGNYMEAIDNE
jgi:hypothetical protein